MIRDETIYRLTWGDVLDAAENAGVTIPPEWKRNVIKSIEAAIGEYIFDIVDDALADVPQDDAT